MHNYFKLYDKPYIKGEPMRFLDLRTDYAFKKVFGSNESKDILISFLNAILYDDQEYKIRDLEVQDPYNPPKLAGMKDSFVDVKATLDNGSTVIIEMQILALKSFEKRILYNVAKNYSAQLVKGEQYNLLNPVIAVTIVDFIMFKDRKDIFSYFKLLEKRDFSTYSDDIELVFIELPKFNKNFNELDGIKDQWLFFLKHAKDLQVLPDNTVKEVKKALEIANYANMTREEQDLYEKKAQYIYAYSTLEEYALERGMKRGIEKGMEEGIKKGRQEERFAMSKKLIGKLDIETISNITGLSVQDINKLKYKKM